VDDASRASKRWAARTRALTASGAMRSGVPAGEPFELAKRKAPRLDSHTAFRAEEVYGRVGSRAVINCKAYIGGA